MPSFERTKQFIGSSSREDARISIIGVPLDITTSYRPGTRFAPSTIRESSYVLEEYDLINGGDIRNVPFEDKGDLILHGGIEDILKEIREAVRGIIERKRIPFVIGGEHLLTLPVVETLKEKGDFSIIVFDAHADMRDEYAGQRYSHATVMRRISEIVPEDRIYQFGIRSGSLEEAEYYKGHRINVFYTDMFLSDKRIDYSVFNRFNGERVYLSVDIDVFDPAFAPGTGTPEPCGLMPFHLMSAIRALKGCSLVGFDIVEVSPPSDNSGITSILAARIIRDVLLHLT